MMTAAQAIARSVSHTEIVTIEYDTEIVTIEYNAEVLADLLVECEGNVEANGITETWGTTDDGGEWRVHVRMAVASV